MPPPSRVARFLMTRRRWKVTRKPLFSMPPPSAPAAFSVTTLSLIVTSPKLSMLMPPPSSDAVLPVKVERLTSTGPPSLCASLSRNFTRVATSVARPWLFRPPPSSPALLPSILTSVSVMWPSPSFRIPPPEARATLPMVGSLVAGHGAVGHRERAAVAVDAAAGGLARVVLDLGVLDEEHAVALVRDCAAVVLGVVVGQDRVGDPDRPDAVVLTRVDDRARVGLVYAGSGDQLRGLVRVRDHLPRVRGIRDEGDARRVHDHLARVVRHAAAHDRDGPRGGVVHRGTA